MSLEKIFIRRAPRDAQHPYMQLLRKVAQDLTITLQERGLLIYILSLPNSWITGIEEMGKMNGIGRNKVRLIMNNLQKAGYCRAQRYKDEKGRYLYVEYLFSEEKMEVVDNQHKDPAPENGAVADIDCEPRPQNRAPVSGPRFLVSGSKEIDTDNTYRIDTNSVDKNSNNTHPNPQGGEAAEAAGGGVKFLSFSAEKEKRKHRKADKTESTDPAMTQPRKHVKLKDEEYEALCKEHSKALIDQLIEEMNDYCASNRPKGYSDYAAAIRQWIRRRDSTSSSPGRYGKPHIDRRTLNKDGKPMDAPHLKDLF